MKRLRRYTSGAAIAAAFAIAALVTGCSSWSFSPPVKGNFVVAPWNLSAAEAAAPPRGTTPIPATSGTFTSDLAGDYSSLAKALYGPLDDHAAADYFSRKGLRAAAGEVVPPEENSNWLIPLQSPDNYRTMLADARARLMTALNSGARERLPALAARAQVSYDCWVERMEQDWWHSVHGRCRQQFEQALAELQGKPQPPAAARVAPPHGPRRYDVYFEFNRANLTPEAHQIIDTVAKAAHGATAKIKLVGKADTVGSDAYNMALSHRRADAVRAALEHDGVPPDRIEERWVGLREPPVPTPPGVREPRNRVVEIDLP